MPTPPTQCPACGAAQLRWVTLRRGRVPIDALQCQVCQKLAVEEDWIAPLHPIMPGRCWNCGDRRDPDHCVTCGLTRQEDVQVHDELRHIVFEEVDPTSGTLSLLDAAKVASRNGRRLLALKLATAATITNENEQGDQARGLRTWLLSAIGEPKAALEDAKQWVEGQTDASALAWASYGHQLQASQSPGTAADAYEKSLRKSPKQHNIRARRAQLLIELGRGGQALEEVIRVLSTEGIDDATFSIASQVAEHLCDEFETQNRDDEVARLLEKAAGYVDRSPSLLAHRARVLGRSDAAAAQRDLKAARRLAPDLPIYARVEKVLRAQKHSWWPW